MKKEAFRKIHRNSEDYMFCDLQLKGRYNIYFESIISHFQCYIVKTKNEKTTYEKEREILHLHNTSQTFEELVRESERLGLTFSH